MSGLRISGCMPHRGGCRARLRGAARVALLTLVTLVALLAATAPMAPTALAADAAATTATAPAPAAAASAAAPARSAEASPARAADAAARRKAGEERRRIARERAAADEGLLARRADCASHFLVNDCVAQARREHRRTVDRLRAETAALDDAERTRRAGLRLAEIDRKRAAAQRAAAAASQPPAQARRHGPGAALPAAPALPRHHGDAAQDAHAREATAAAERAGKRARIEQDVQAHRRKIEQRNAADAAAGRKQSAPLPTPSAAASTSPAASAAAAAPPAKPASR